MNLLHEFYILYPSHIPEHRGHLWAVVVCACLWTILGAVGVGGVFGLFDLIGRSTMFSNVVLYPIRLFLSHFYGCFRLITGKLVMFPC